MKKLHYIHIGKCGGSSLQEAVYSSALVRSNYSEVIRSHIGGVKKVENCDHLLVIRNPIERAISAFSWRKKLVVVEKRPEQVSRFPGEDEVLRRYQSLSDLAETLYMPATGVLNQNAARDFDSIHHLRENIQFYLNPLLPLLDKGNILGVIVQERMNQDVKRILGIDLTSREKENDSKLDSLASMSESAIANLKRYLSADYGSITELWCKGCLDDEGYRLLMNLS